MRAHGAKIYLVRRLQPYAALDVDIEAGRRRRRTRFSRWSIYIGLSWR